jgi:thiamine-phosphate pyrophosphorylase
VILPRLLLLTDRRACARPLLEVVAAAVRGGARAVLLREKDLGPAHRARLADELRALLAPVEGTLIVAGAGAGGPAVHLSAAEPLPAPRPALLGRSCHDAGEVARAGAEGCDWVTVSPVHPTVSKPGYGPALGSAGLAALCRVPGAPPVYALGGVSRSNARACRSAGAYGVAVMGGVMRAERPDRCVELLLGELSLSGPAEKSAP